MLKSKKFWIFSSIICISVGLLLICAAWVSAGFHLSAFNTVHYQRIETPITEPYDKIVIDALDCNVRILAQSATSAFPDLQEQKYDTPMLLSHDSEYMVTELTVRDRTLYITRQDNRPWYQHIGIYFGDGNEGITLILDDLHFDALNVTSVSGEIWLMSEAEIKEVSLHSTSGEIVAIDLISEKAEMSSVSGSVLLHGASGDSISLKTVSGEIDAANMQCGTFKAESTSGDLSIGGNVICGKATIKTVSGDVELEGFDADDINITTTSGDVEGSLLSGKQFSVTTSSGEIDIPKDSPNAGHCVVTTTSGDIEIKIQ